MAIISPQNETLLFWLSAANFNSTADQALTPMLNFASYLVTRIRIVDASISLTTAAGGFYTGASKGGVTVVAAGQTYSALTGPTLGMDATISAAGMDRLVASIMYLSLTTAQGSAATAGVYVIGIPLT